MATVQTHDPALQTPTVAEHDRQKEVILVSHSSFYYWWPLWAGGYLMALLTWLGGHPVQIGDGPVLIHPNSTLGITYSIILFLVIFITNVSLRGLASVVVIMGVMFVTLLFAYFDWWDPILSMLPHWRIYMNLGFYVTFATVVFLLWVFATFIYDRMSYWRIRPGQVTHEFIIGARRRATIRAEWSSRRTTKTCSATGSWGWARAT